MDKKEEESEIEILDFEPNNETVKKNIDLKNNEKEPKKIEIVNKQKDNQIAKKENIPNKKSNKIRGIITAIFIFGILGTLIYYLPNIMQNISKDKEIQSDNKIDINKKFSSGINIKEVLNDIKEDKNYIYEENIEVNTIDKKSIPQKVTTNLIYQFNPTKFQIDISKTVGDYNEVSYEYYEKNDENHTKYLYDIITKKINTISTSSDEYNSINNIYTKIIDNLINNSEIYKEEATIINNEDVILIQTKNNKNIYQLLSFKTDRINSEIDIDKIDDEDIYVNYIFSKDKKLLKIEFELETIEAYKETNLNNVTAINIKFTFRDFNTVKDIIIPKE